MVMILVAVILVTVIIVTVRAVRGALGWPKSTRSYYPLL